MKTIMAFFILLFVASSVFAGDVWITSMLAPANSPGEVHLTNFGPSPIRILVFQYVSIDDSLAINGEPTDSIIEAFHSKTLSVEPSGHSQQMLLITCAPFDTDCVNSTSRLNSALAISAGWLNNGNVVPVTFQHIPARNVRALLNRRRR